jgi:hypothetical protein
MTCPSIAVKDEPKITAVINAKGLTLRERVIAEIKAANVVDKFYEVGERGVCEHVLLKFAGTAKADVIWVDWMMKKTFANLENQFICLYMREVSRHMKSVPNKKLLEIMGLDAFAGTFKAPYEKLKAKTVAKLAKTMHERDARQRSW